MPFCSKCGKEIGENEKFCPSCGFQSASPFAGAQEYLQKVKSEKGMLELLRKAFRVTFSICILLIFIACPVFGGIIGNGVGSIGGYGGGEVGYILLGIFFGLIAGFVTVIIAGGLIATFIEICENTRVIREDIESRRGTQ